MPGPPGGGGLLMTMGNRHAPIDVVSGRVSWGFHVRETNMRRKIWRSSVARSPMLAIVSRAQGQAVAKASPSGICSVRLSGAPHICVAAGHRHRTSAESIAVGA